jgi:hypothetical protein
MILDILDGTVFRQFVQQASNLILGGIHGKNLSGHEGTLLTY